MNNFVYDVNSVILENGVVRFGGDLQQFGGVKIDLTDARNDLDFIDAIMSAVISLTDNVREDGAKINDEEKVTDQEILALIQMSCCILWNKNATKRNIIICQNFSINMPKVMLD